MKYFISILQYRRRENFNEKVFKDSILSGLKNTDRISTIC
jgi:hypothetical protein